MFFVILAFIAIAVALVWYFLAHDHGRKLPIGSLWIAFGFGVFGMFLASGLEQFFVPDTLTTAPEHYSTAAKLLIFLGVGLVEESAKFVPLALFIYRRSYFREHTDGCIYFAICGLTFGLGENIMYTLQFGASVGLVRLILTPFLHAATTSILGYYFINQKLRRPSSKRLFVLACALIPLLHSSYDFGLGSGIPELVVLSLMITLLLTLGLFLYFMEANSLDKLAMAGVSAAVHDTPSFCPDCGRQNAYKRAYCEYCGRQL